MAGGPRWRDRQDRLRGPPIWQFSVLPEEPTVERDPLTFCTYVALFHFKVLFHERRRTADRYSGGKEYSWVIKRRFSEFQELDSGLREVVALPEDVALPRKTLWRHIYPSDSFVKERGWELLQYLSNALAAVSLKAASEYNNAIDAADLCDALPEFLGMQLKEVAETTAEARKWMPPPGAEERQVSLVRTLDRGVFVHGHLDAGVQLTKHDRQAFLGDLTCTHAETRHSLSKACPAKLSSTRRRTDAGPQSPTSSPPFSNSGWSEASSPILSPIPSPAESRVTSPRKRVLSSDDATSSASFSTADTICKVDLELVEEPVTLEPVSSFRKPASPCAWMELDLDNELTWSKDHNDWWARLANGHFAQASLGPETTSADRQRLLERFESVAAKWRELSVDNELLHTILGYGTDKGTMVIVHQTAPSFCGLRHFPFRKDRCHLLLSQAAKAIAYLHKNGLVHGHLSPESFMMDENSLEPRVRVSWTPGQRRSEGHAPATFGFKGPGEDFSPAADVWAFGCVILVWFANFKPARGDLGLDVGEVAAKQRPHPWFQFAKNHRLKEAIQNALAQTPPELPQALLELHGSAAGADESDTHIALAVQICTRCLEYHPRDRATAEELELETAAGEANFA